MQTTVQAVTDDEKRIKILNKILYRSLVPNLGGVRASQGGATAQRKQK